MKKMEKKMRQTERHRQRIVGTDNGPSHHTVYDDDPLVITHNVTRI
jgi:hypothetical protein